MSYCFVDLAVCTPFSCSDELSSSDISSTLWIIAIFQPSSRKSTMKGNLRKILWVWYAKTIKKRLYRGDTLFCVWWKPGPPHMPGKCSATELHPQSKEKWPKYHFPTICQNHSSFKMHISGITLAKMFWSSRLQHYLP
jgi:hypothetical protein